MRSALLNSRPSAVRPCVSRRRSSAVIQCTLTRALPLGKCPYRTLGISYDAGEEEIKVAFRRKAKQVHPDVSKDPVSHIAFMECQNAYQTLLDPEKRAKYDQTLQPRASSQVLSYLNTRSAQRHGIRTAPSRAGYEERPELYTTMLELLQQVKVAAKHLEREVVGKEGYRVVTAPQPVRPAVPQCTGGRIHVPDSSSECGDGECCEPWLFYAIQAAKEEEEQAARRRV